MLFLFHLLVISLHFLHGDTNNSLTFFLFPFIIYSFVFNLFFCLHLSLISYQFAFYIFRFFQFLSFSLHWLTSSFTPPFSFTDIKTNDSLYQDEWCHFVVLHYLTQSSTLDIHYYSITLLLHVQSHNP